MEIDEYKKLYELENSYWWYVGRRFIIESVLRKFVPSKRGRALDIGCGTGINLGMLSGFASEVVGMDKFSGALDYCKHRGFNNLELLDVESISSKSENSFDIVTLLDVLEHVEDDDKALRDIHRILKPGGLLIMTVPAYQFLWSEHDVALHHKRRYILNRLVLQMEEAGFKVEKSSYAIVCTFPIIVSYRIIKGIINKFIPSTPKTSHVILPSRINNLFVLPLKLEARLINAINFPFGTSIIVVGKK